MAMIKCRECGKDISDMAKACPHCGVPTNPRAERMKEVGSGLQNFGAGCSSIGTVLIVIVIIIILIALFSK